MVAYKDVLYTLSGWPLSSFTIGGNGELGFNKSRIGCVKLQSTGIVFFLHTCACTLKVEENFL